MAILRILSIIAATLFLVAGAVAGGYYAAQQAQQGNDTGNAAAVADTPMPFRGFTSPRLTLSDGLGTGCRMDFTENSAVCTGEDGTAQYMSIDKDTQEMIFRTVNDGECVGESTMPLPAEEEGSLGGSGSDASELIQLKTQTKRVNSWEISVPSELGGDSLDQFEYFEKDGAPWKIEAFEKGSDEPVVVELSQPKGADMNDPEWMPNQPEKEMCANKGRTLTNLFETEARAVAPSNLRGRKNVVFILAIGIGALAIGAILLFVSIIGITELIKLIAKECSRRRMLTGSMTNTALLQSAATAAVVGGVANAIAGSVNGPEGMQLLGNGGD